MLQQFWNYFVFPAVRERINADNLAYCREICNFFAILF